MHYSSISIADLRDTILDLFDRHRNLESYSSTVHHDSANIRKTVAELNDKMLSLQQHTETAESSSRTELVKQCSEIETHNRDLQQQMVELVQIVSDNQRRINSLEPCKEPLTLPTTERPPSPPPRIYSPKEDLAPSPPPLILGEPALKSEEKEAKPEPPKANETLPIFDSNNQLKLRYIASADSNSGNDISSVLTVDCQPVPVWTDDPDIQQLYEARFLKQNQERLTSSYKTLPEEESEFDIYEGKDVIQMLLRIGSSVQIKQLDWTDGIDENIWEIIVNR